MNSYELHQEGLLSDRGAVIAALLADGWPRDEAETVATAVAREQPGRWERWERWTPEQIGVLLDAIGPDMVRPSSETVAALAAQVGRSVKSTSSKIDRILAEHVDVTAT